MKSVFKLAAVALVGINAGEMKPVKLIGDDKAPAVQTNMLTGDFLTGFESGIFLRDKPEQVKEYGCPKAEVKMEEFKKV